MRFDRAGDGAVDCVGNGAVVPAWSSDAHHARGSGRRIGQPPMPRARSRDVRGAATNEVSAYREQLAEIMRTDCTRRRCCIPDRLDSDPELAERVDSELVDP